MDATLLVHITAGGLGIGSGFIALAVTKGGAPHRRFGTVFVVVMLAMALTGLTITVVHRVTPAINIPAALITVYLVVTAWVTIRPPFPSARVVSVGAMVVALAVGVVSITFGFEAVVNGGAKDQIPAFPFFLFGVIGLAAGISDVRFVRHPPRGGPRLVRHLWRMCFALFIAAMSFFLGQADEIPAGLRIPVLLAIPILVPLVVMLYWLWDLNRKPSTRRWPRLAGRLQTAGVRRS